jgi:hypothetical protein
VVKLSFVDNSMREAPSRPIGVLAALALGFDKVAAKPLLIIPPLLLDLFLWLGPHLTIPKIFQQLVSSFSIPAGTELEQVEYIAALQQWLTDLGEGWNLFGALSSFLVKLPSLMAGRIFITTPLGKVGAWTLDNPMVILASWAGLMVIGLGFGAFFHRWIAQQVAPEAQLSSGWIAWGRVILFALLVFIGLFVISGVTMFITSAVGMLVGVIGLGLIIIGVSILFWAIVYLWFTPHGIIRYRFGVVQAMLESIYLVRWNLFSTIGFLLTSYVITWLSTQVWLLPTEDSWYSILAMVGHAFVGATLLAASYVFYQGRHAWLEQMKAKLSAQKVGGENQPGSNG